ncbi:MAG: peptide chain release factor N(5)-glutamine methyltransferase [Pedobacter sp.]|nr:MAG: peptide chain release factor N(5)-glutamine methyltransferase [Pedobacter sp.]
MNLKDIRSAFVTELNDIYDAEEALSIFYVVAEELTGIKKINIILSLENVVPDEDEKRYHEVLGKLKQGIPVQQILGKALFYQMNFKVSADVLIPRPETEELVEWILTDAGGKDLLKVLDIGTGSGCIAISLQKHLNHANTDALDVSMQALEIAKYNAQINSATIDFIEADILRYDKEQQYDIIVSNPPYITDAEKSDMRDNVMLHEPHLALFVDDPDPLLFYKAISDYAKKNLASGGRLYFEINELFGQETVEMIKAKGFTNIELKKDMQGKARMVGCSQP